jgi:signal transduction histidine kinase
VEYLCEFANASLNAAGIRFLLEAPAILPDARLNATERHQLFLAAKEALRNSIKMGGATEVRLRIQVVGSQLRLQIEDNGPGLPRQSVPSEGDSMESRMDRVGGSFSRLNRPGTGSCVELSLGVRFP